jgi:predicted PurR-regulated permease PerM
MSIFRQKVELTISNKTIFRVLAMIGIALLSVKLVSALSQALTLILIAAFLAMALNPAVSRLAKAFGQGRRTAATAVAFFSVIIVLVVYLSLVIPPLVRQVGDFVDTVPETIQDLKNQNSPVGRAIRQYNMDTRLDDFARDFGSRLEAKPVIDTAGRIGGGIVSTLAVLAMTFMMLNEGPAWIARMQMVVPLRKRKHSKELLNRMYGMVTGYVNGQLIMATIAAALLLVVLLIASSLLHVSVNAVALAGIMAIFGLVPMIGNPIGAFIVVGACLLSSFNLAIFIAIYFVVYMQIENMTLQPYVQSKQNDLTPLTVFVSALLGISYGGILGALFAIPIAGCIRILLLDWIAEHKELADTSEAK